MPFISSTSVFPSGLRARSVSKPDCRGTLSICSLSWGWRHGSGARGAGVCTLQWAEGNAFGEVAFACGMSILVQEPLMSDVGDVIAAERMRFGDGDLKH